MQDGPIPANANASATTPEREHGGKENLLPPIKKGEVRNPRGVNGWQKARERMLRFVKAVDQARGDGDTSRFIHLMDAIYSSALMPGLKGAADRKLLLEQIVGKAKTQLEVSGSLDFPVNSTERHTTSELRDQLRAVLDVLAPMPKPVEPKADPGESAGPASPEPASAE